MSLFGILLVIEHVKPILGGIQMEQLINEQPMYVLPTLAEKFGVDKALMLQILHNKISEHGIFMDEYTWISQTYTEWEREISFWNLNKIKRTLLKLEEYGVVASTDEYNESKMDRTKWYAIDYPLLKMLLEMV